MEKLILMENKELTRNKKITIDIKKLDRKAILIGLMGLIILVIFPILATKYSWIDFSTSGQIGDTIGGLTAPIVGIFSALLIYFSFRAQIMANYIVQSQIDEQKLEEDERNELLSQMEIYKELKESLKQFPFYVDGGEIYGSYAITRFLSDGNRRMFTARSISVIPFEGILKLFEILIIKIENSKNKGFDVELVITLVNFQFNQYFWEANQSLILRLSQSENKSNYIVIACNKINDLNARLTSLNGA